jgi:hypothetical protein
MKSGVIGLLPHPLPAGAQDQKESKLRRCLQEAIASCDEDFGGETEYMVAIRGWCYMIRGGICWTTD